MKKKQVTQLQYDHLENAVWQAFIEQATPIALYHAVQTSNWGDNDYLLQTLVNDPSTDKAIILLIYWMSSPAYFKQFSNRAACIAEASHAIFAYNLIETIEDKYQSDFYKQNSLACDPRNLECYEDEDVVIPAAMYKKLEGVDIPEPDYFAYTEGLPDVYYEQLDNLLDLYEVTDVTQQQK